MTARGGLLLPAAVVAAVGLLALAIGMNLARQCAAAADAGAAACDARVDGSPAHLQALRHEIGANPGHAGAYARLADLVRGEQRAAVLRAASAVAPNEPAVLRARAALALDEPRLADAARDLVQLSELYAHVLPEPSQVLARLIAAGHGDLLKPYLRPGSRWLGHVLGTMLEMQLPLAAAGPLITQASAQGVLERGRLQDLQRRLKEAGSWVDAYGLWVGQHQGRVPVLYNAGFEHLFQPDGFDWEVNEGPLGRSGVQVARRSFAPRGFVLEVRYTGRGVQGVPVRQYLYLSPGRYRLAGQYRTENLKSEQGLAWAVRCVSGAALAKGDAGPPAGRSAALGDTQDDWRGFSFDIEVPGDCGPVASLQLETFAPYEAAVGLRGRAYFDAFELSAGAAP